MRSIKRIPEKGYTEWTQKRVSRCYEGKWKIKHFLFILHVSVHEKTILRDYSVYSYSGIRLIERDLSQEKKCAERDTVPPK